MRSIPLFYENRATTLDPTKANCIPDNELQHAITEGLVRNTGGEIKPGVAESWEVSEDGLTYTFHLNPDAKWSDGEQIKAQDFVYGWQRLVDPATAMNTIVFVMSGQVLVITWLLF